MCVCVIVSATVGCRTCLCITDLAAGAFTGEKDADQQEVKLSALQQDSGPEVSRVTCQAKEITACHRPTEDCPRHWPTKHTVNRVKAVVP